MTKIREQATQLIKRTVGGSDHKDWFVELEDGIVELVDSQKKELLKNVIRQLKERKYLISQDGMAEAYIQELINDYEDIINLLELK